jgi:hypothetical protein
MVLTYLVHRTQPEYRAYSSRQNKRNRNWHGSRPNDVEAVDQVFGANEVEIKQMTLEALRLLRQPGHALDKIRKYLADHTVNV